MRTGATMVGTPAGFLAADNTLAFDAGHYETKICENCSAEFLRAIHAPSDHERILLTILTQLSRENTVSSNGFYAHCKRALRELRGARFCIACLSCGSMSERAQSLNKSTLESRRKIIECKD